MVVFLAACATDSAGTGSEPGPLGTTTGALAQPADLAGSGGFGLMVKGDSKVSSDALVLNLTLSSETPLWAEEIVVYAGDKTTGETFRMPWPDLDHRASEAIIDGIVNVAVEIPPTFADSAAIVEVTGRNEKGEQDAASLTLAPSWVKSLAADEPEPTQVNEQNNEKAAVLPVGLNKQIANQMAAEAKGVMP